MAHTTGYDEGVTTARESPSGVARNATRSDKLS